ncbi:hypothetical protein BGW36DRAFT_385938 [Talaromyces proteolyticus]|uniref:Peroxin 20 n=1 Tax=Talaromyces proteolyticus TaxID=1131652 RepID=A0AAD4KLX1_9EURO|nr:uncharacterized protein BGW36DRAFT_385938 [Talaromyces proteolyticus]KAH8693132.1 hypothetical protein BGW36DRAFT_385938 [Talaromyces proteolyticus]
MADALCGPSNALQNFQKHTAVDRTLQQDRLVNHQSSAQQGFRSQNPNANILDAEFESFENNFAGNVVPMLERPGSFGPPLHAQTHPAFAPPDVGDWASDFQNLRVSGPPQNLHQHHNRPIQASNGSHSANWQDEFTRHQQQNSQNLMNRSVPMANFQAPFMPTYQMPAGMAAPLSSDQGTVQSHSNQESATYDEGAFEAAFEQAQADIDQQQTASTEQHQQAESDANQSSSKELQPENTQQIRIGSDLIVDTTDANVQEQKEDPDELARTAGHLLDSLSHDNSKKFKESNFLALMRRIRDREVHVEGDEFRETSQPLHPGGRGYPRVSEESRFNAGDGSSPIPSATNLQ